MHNHLTRYYFLCLFLFVCCNNKAQHKQPSNRKQKLSLCEKGKIDAKKSFENGNFTFTSYGLSLSLLRKKYQYDNIYDSILLYDYKIKKVNGGCTIDDYSKCYEKELRKLVENKYGKNYRDVAKSKTLNIYTRTKEYKSEVLPLFQKDTIFNRVEPTEYDKKLKRTKYITKYIKNSRLSDSIKNSKISFKYVLFKNGKIDIIKFYSPKEIEHQIRIKNVLKNMPQLTPSYFFTQPVNTFNRFTMKN